MNGEPGGRIESIVIIIDEWTSSSIIRARWWQLAASRTTAAACAPSLKLGERAAAKTPPPARHLPAFTLEGHRKALFRAVARWPEGRRSQAAVAVVRVKSAAISDARGINELPGQRECSVFTATDEVPHGINGLPKMARSEVADR